MPPILNASVYLKRQPRRGGKAEQIRIADELTFFKEKLII